MLKKVIFAAALVALMVPTTFAGRSYLHSDGSWSGSPGSTDSPASTPDRETTDNSSGQFEIKAENYNWPASYDFVDAAIIPVKMEVGFWIKLNTKDKVLILKQVEIHKYAGSVTIGIECNVNIEVKGSFSALNGMPGMAVETLSLNDGGDTTAVNAPGADVKVYLKIKDVDLKAFNVSTQVGKCIQIGNITLKVRPTVKPNIAGAC